MSGYGATSAGFRRWLVERWLVDQSVDWGERVAGFWLKRPSECEDFREWDGKSPNGSCRCDERQQVAHAGLSARQRRKQHDLGAGARWLPWDVRDRLDIYGWPRRHRSDRDTWSTFAANVLHYEVVEPLNRLEGPPYGRRVRTIEDVRNAATVNA